MNYADVFKIKDSSAFPSLLLFHGEEEYIKEQALAHVRGAVVAPGFEAVDMTVYDGDVRPQALSEACETLPMMSPRRLVVARDIPALCASKPAEEDVKRLTAYMANVPPSTILLLYVRDRADARKAVFKAALKESAVVEFARLGEREAAGWAAKELRKAGKVIAPLVAEKLVMTAGCDLTRLGGEILKLAAYAGERGEITPEDIAAVVTRTVESTVFEMCDALLAGDGARSYKLLKELDEAGENPVGLLMLLARTLQTAYRARQWLDTGARGADLAAKMGITGYAATRTAERASRKGAAWWRSACALCADAETAIKQGRERDELAFARVVGTLLSGFGPEK